MQNSIDNIYQLLDIDQIDLIETRHLVGDLTARYIDMHANYVRFKSDFTALETLHRSDMAAFQRSIDPFITPINENKRHIDENDAQLRKNKEELEKAKSCSKNCDEEFVRKVMDEINRSLNENKVNVKDFDSEFNKLKNEIDSLKTIDDKIIAEFDDVLIEIQKLDSLGVKSPPFLSFELLNNSLNETSASLERKRDNGKRQNGERANYKSQLSTQKYKNHVDKTVLFDDILDLVTKKSPKLTSRFASMIPKVNKIKADLDDLNISLGRLPKKINQVSIKVEDLLNNYLNGSQSDILGSILLVGVVFLIFFFDCFVVKKY